MAKMKGLKNASTLNSKFTDALEKFINAENDDEVIDDRILPKKKDKKKPKLQKVRH